LIAGVISFAIWVDFTGVFFSALIGIVVATYFWRMFNGRARKNE